MACLLVKNSEGKGMNETVYLWGASRQPFVSSAKLKQKVNSVFVAIYVTISRLSFVFRLQYENIMLKKPFFVFKGLKVGLERSSKRT